MSNIQLSVSNAQKAIDSYKDLSESTRSTKAINSKYKVVNKHHPATDLFFKLLSALLPGHLHFAQTNPQAVLKQLNKLKRQATSERDKQSIERLIGEFKQIDEVKKTTPPEKIDLSKLSLKYEEVGNELRVEFAYEGTLVGTSAISYEQNKTHIFTIQILEAYRGKGLGKKALAEIMQHLDKHPKFGTTDYFYLECDKDSAASHLYQLEGFQFVPFEDLRCTIPSKQVFDSGYVTMIRPSPKKA